MRFVPTQLPGAFVIELDPNHDERGFFARSFCAREFAEQGLAARFVQCSVSVTSRRGTVRGLHFQRPPAVEVKLVRCTAGAVHDVIVDLREESPTYLRHAVVELSAQNRRTLYVPERFAHGFQSLEDQSELFYQISEFQSQEHATGLRFDDPRLGIAWPLPLTVISGRDRQWPLLGKDDSETMSARH